MNKIRLHRFITSLLISLLMWTIIARFIVVDISLWKYFIIELLITLGIRVTKFSFKYLGI